jgi:formate-dependent nitrite reductase cytochrome c552 subunit
MLACWSCCRGDVNFVILENGEVINFGHVSL